MITDYKNRVVYAAQNNRVMKKTKKIKILKPCPYYAVGTYGAIEVTLVDVANKMIAEGYAEAVKVTRAIKAKK